MAIAFVNGSRGGNTASASSIATTASSLTAGNLTVVAFYIDDVTKSPSGVPTDTAGNTYLQAGTTQASGGGAGNLAMYYAYNCLGNASNTVTLNLSGSSGYRAWARWQFSGVPTSPDPTISTGLGSGTTETTLPVSAALSHGSGESVIVVLGLHFSTAMTGGLAGYTYTGFAITGDVIVNYGDEYLIGSSDSTPSMTTTAGSAWGIMAAGFGTPAATTRNSRVPLLGVR